MDPKTKVSPSQDNRHPLIPTNRYFPFARNLRGYYLHPEKRKIIIKKYYARKILFVQKNTDLTPAINRSKYFLRFKVSHWYISSIGFKSLANFVLIRTDLRVKSYPLGHRWRDTSSQSLNLHPLQIKKALRYCKNPQLVLPYLPQPQLKHVQHLSHLKSLFLSIENGSSMNKASKVIPKLRFLRSLHVKYISDYDGSNPNLPIKQKSKPVISDPDDKKGWGFFYKISKLPRLLRFSLQTSLKTLQEQSIAVQQDFADFYSGSHKFKIDTEVYVSSRLDTKELTTKNLSSILKKVDSLSLRMGIPKAPKKNPYNCRDYQKSELSQQEIKQGERPVKLYVLYKEKRQVNIGCLLSQCENLASLYLKISGIEIFWDQNYENFPQKLQTMVLDVDFLGLKYEILDDRRPPSRFQIEEVAYEVIGQRKVKFHSGLLELLKQIKARAIGLETFTLFMCLESFRRSWYQPRDFKDLFEKMVEEKMREFFEELESFEKFHRVDICKKMVGDLDECLDRMLAAKSLKMVNVRK